MAQCWLLLGLLVSSGLASVWPDNLWNPFVASAPWLGLLIALTMFTVGCLLPIEELRQVGRNWPMVIAGTALQYTSMPLLAYLIGRAFQFDPGTMAGIILVGCVPGAMASNVLTLLARGNTSYSVCLTTLATLISPLAVPAALWLTLDARHSLNFGATAFTLCWQVVFPVLAGFGFCRLIPRLQAAMDVAGSWIANAVILWIIAAVVALNKQRMGDMTGSILIALLLINTGGYLAGYFGGYLFRLNEPMRRALTLEIGMQNCGLGTTLALQLFPDTAAAVPTAIYTFGCMFTGTLLATWWSKRPCVDVPAQPVGRPVAVAVPSESAG